MAGITTSSPRPGSVSRNRFVDSTIRPGRRTGRAAATSTCQGTIRRQYRGGGLDLGYTWVEPIDTEALAEGSVDDEVFRDWLSATNRATDYEPAPAWPEGEKPDARQQAYLDKALTGCCQKVALAPEGERNHTIFMQALKVASYVKGAGLDDAHAKNALLKAATKGAGLSKAEAITAMRSAWARATPACRPSVRRVFPFLRDWEDCGVSASFASVVPSRGVEGRRADPVVGP